MLITSEGKKKLIEEFNFLSTIEKRRLIAELADARDRGGVAENSEYDIAKEEYEKLESKIKKLQQRILNSEVISSVATSTDKVSVMSVVKVENLSNGKSQDFKLVTDTEIDIKSGKISINSPIGSGLIDKKVGDVATIKTPGGVVEFKILEIGL
jgi:transcription elongation factor GreA